MKNTAPTSDRDETIPFNTVAPPGGDPKLLDELDSAGVTYRVRPPPNPVGWSLLSWLLPLMVLAALWYPAYRRAGAAGSNIFGVGKSKATAVASGDVGVSYKDIGGADEAIAELQEIIQFLKTPERFARLGGKIPKGVPLVGPPGTGKTLIAKATAGEAQVPFFETSGSDFVEMFVGVGAARVRDLFEQARQVAPAIVFIDDIDAIGQSRGAALRVVVHECGHALVAQLVPHGDPVSKVSIVPRTRGTLGYTLQMPAEDRYLLTVEELDDRLAVMLAGRAAEKTVFGTISTGASDDIQRTELARRMVTEFGMSDKLGSVRYAGPQLQYLGGVIADTSQLSPHTRDAIDSEIQRIVDAQFARAQQLIVEHRTALDSLMTELLKSETVDGSMVRHVLERSTASA